MDEFYDIVANTPVEPTKKPFKIYKLKLEHHHWHSGQIKRGMPILTPIEYIEKYACRNRSKRFVRFGKHI